MRHDLAALLAALAALAPAAAAQTTQHLLLPQPFGGATFGSDIASAGDTNADGVPDVIASGYDFFLGGGFARVYSGVDASVLFSVVTGFDPEIPGAFLPGASVAGIGDVNADGHDDVLVGAPEVHPDFPDPGHAAVVSGATGLKLYLVGGFLGGPSQDQFGTSCSPAGDVDLDGVPDFAVGAKKSNVVRVFSGASGVLLHAIPPPPGSGAFGDALGNATDLTGDGKPDLLVGAPTSSLAGFPVSTGAAYLASGAGGGIVRVFVGGATGDKFGADVALVGDANGDGIGDVAIGAPGSDLGSADSGAVSVRSSTNGLPIWTATGVTPGEELGATVSAIGDLDGDGRVDTLAGAPKALGAPGLAGGALRWLSGLDGSVLASFASIVPQDSVGARAAGIGDLDGDGLPEAATFRHTAFGGFPNRRGVILSVVPGLQEYGIGTPGCSGVHLLDGNGVPALGNAAFQILSTAAPLSDRGLLLVTDVQDVPGSDPFGIDVLLHSSFAGATEVLGLDILSGASGIGVAAAPIPANPLLVGRQFFASVLWAWAGGPCVPSLYTLSSSVGLAITIQP